MTEPVFNIKPLEWQRHTFSESARAFTPVGVYYAFYASTGRWSVHLPGRWQAMDTGKADSFEAAKEAAESHYRERLMGALEPVDVMQFRDIGEFRGEIEEFLSIASLVEEQDKEIERLTEHNQELIDASGQECGCGYDDPNDVCLGHLPKFRRLEAEIKRLKRAMPQTIERSLPNDMQEFAERHKLGSFMETLWNNAFQNGWRACQKKTDELLTEYEIEEEERDG